MIYKVGNAIEIVYQATKATSGLTDVTMVIYDETHTLDGVNFPNVILTELGSTGRYYGSFIPDVVGEWTILVGSVTKKGSVVKKFSVGNYNVDDVQAAIATLNDLSVADITSALTSYDVATVDDISGQPMLG